jgi:hypothetical protein
VVPGDHFHTDGAMFVPGIELANHRPRTMVGRAPDYQETNDINLDFDKKLVTLTAGQNYTAGQELCMDYGRVPNLFTIYYQGYVLDKNMYDYFPVVVPTTDGCKGTPHVLDDGEGKCEYTMTPLSINTDYLDY